MSSTAIVDGEKLASGVLAGVVAVGEGQFVLGLQLGEIGISYWLSTDECRAVSRWCPDDYQRILRLPLFYQLSAGVVTLRGCDCLSGADTLPPRAIAVYLAGSLLTVGDATIIGGLASAALEGR